MVAETHSGKHAQGLMLLHDLHRADIVVGDAVSCYAVFSAEQVAALDVEPIDVLSLILYLSTFVHSNSRHPLENIAYGAVLLLREGCHVVGQRVALFSDF